MRLLKLKSKAPDNIQAHNRLFFLNYPFPYDYIFSLDRWKYYYTLKA
jgi:hypothetical protein